MHPEANVYHRDYVISVAPHARSGWVAYFHPTAGVMAPERELGASPDEALRRAIWAIDNDLPLTCPMCGDPEPGAVWEQVDVDHALPARCPACDGEGVVWGVKRFEEAKCQI